MKTIKDLKYNTGLIIKDLIIKLKIKRDNKRPTIYLFACPYHSNLGDHAITQNVIEWLVENFPGYRIFPLTMLESRASTLNYIRKSIKKEDLISFVGGYHLTDLYAEQNIHCLVAKLFPDFPIFIFPQTVNYREIKEAEKTSEIFNNHGMITVMCRDSDSYEVAMKLFHKCQVLLIPDIVTYKIGKYFYGNNRRNILFCLRKNKQQESEYSFFKPNDVNYLLDKCKNFADVEVSDTVLDTSNKTVTRNREKILKQTIDEYSKFKIIITNKYHGMIFSLIAGTPVIVLASSDYKFSSGKLWFVETYKDYFYYCSTNEEVIDAVKKILNEKFSYKLQNHFMENYWSKLKSNLRFKKLD
jgi:exopolysaccharide biosynthesis predicted pyruvyltransferase EpsI